VGFTLPYPFGDGFRVSWAKMKSLLVDIWFPPREIWQDGLVWRELLVFQLRGMQMGVKHQPHFKHLDMNGKNEAALEGNDMMHIDIQSMIRYLDIFGLCQNRGHIDISKWRVEC